MNLPIRSGYFLVKYRLIHILVMEDYSVVNECVWVRTELQAAVLTLGHGF